MLRQAGRNPFSPAHSALRVLMAKHEPPEIRNTYWVMALCLVVGIVLTGLAYGPSIDPA